MDANMIFAACGVMLTGAALLAAGARWSGSIQTTLVDIGKEMRIIATKLEDFLAGSRSSVRCVEHDGRLRRVEERVGETRERVKAQSDRLKVVESACIETKAKMEGHDKELQELELQLTAIDPTGDKTARVRRRQAAKREGD